MFSTCVGFPTPTFSHSQPINIHISLSGDLCECECVSCDELVSAGNQTPPDLENGR